MATLALSQPDLDQDVVGWVEQALGKVPMASGQKRDATPMNLPLCFWLCLFLSVSIVVPAQIEPTNARLYLDFANDSAHSTLQLYHGAKRISGRFGGALEFTSALQYAEIQFSRALTNTSALTIGGWFFPYRTGEQSFFFRGLSHIEPRGNRMFPPQPTWVNFLLGTDDRGFLLGTINGNGTMPFPQVTISEIGFGSWHQLAVVKTTNGFQKFYHNGVLVHTDEHAAAAGKIWPFIDTAIGEPVRLAMPLGGLIGESWIFSREVSAPEIKADFTRKKSRYHPALPAAGEALREMNSFPSAHLWPRPLTKESWPRERQSILNALNQILGAPPALTVPLDPRVISETDCGSYIRRKISIQVQPRDRMPAYLLVPKKLGQRVPAVICFYGTTSGAGKETTTGLSGPSPGSPPAKNRDFAVDVIQAGWVAFAADYLRDGERIRPGRRPYDTSDFYEEFPEWSIHGKDAWDNARAIDFLQSLDFVDSNKIGMMGHSYGGHSTLFAAALDPRIRVAAANGPVSDFIHHGLHWAVPKGAASSQSLPAMRPYVLDPTLPIPLTFYELTALIAPRPLWIGQAAGERRPMEEQNHAAVRQVYSLLNHPERVRYLWYAGDHDFPPEARRAAIDWFRHWFSELNNP